MALLVRDGQVLMVHRHPDRQFYPNCVDGGTRWQMEHGAFPVCRVGECRGLLPRSASATGRGNRFYNHSG